MRNEFYADLNDVWKWSVALKAASKKDGIVYVVMFRPDAQRALPGDADPRVVEFFRKEWDEIYSRRRVERINKLALISDGLIYIDATYTNATREAYFKKVDELLKARPSSQRHVVLLDPDTGIAGMSSDHTHVHPDQIKSTWKAMRGDDVLMIYQHSLRRKNRAWISEKRRALAQTIHITESAVETMAYRNVCFFLVERAEA